jgi:hypothetical protein
VPAEGDAARAGAQRERRGRRAGHAGRQEPFAGEQIGARGQDGGRVGGVAAGEGGLRLATAQRDGGSRAPVDGLDRVVGEDGADRRTRERHDDPPQVAAAQQQHREGDCRPDGRMCVRLSRQRADAGRAAEAWPVRPDGMLEGIVPGLHAGCTGGGSEEQGSRAGHGAGGTQPWDRTGGGHRWW